MLLVAVLRVAAHLRPRVFMAKHRSTAAREANPDRAAGGRTARTPRTAAVKWSGLLGGR